MISWSFQRDGNWIFKILWVSRAAISRYGLTDHSYHLTTLLRCLCEHGQRNQTYPLLGSRLSHLHATYRNMMRVYLFFTTAVELNAWRQKNLCWNREAKKDSGPYRTAKLYKLGIVSKILKGRVGLGLDAWCLSGISNQCRPQGYRVSNS